jgi:hypothetical protein
MIEPSSPTGIATAGAGVGYVAEQQPQYSASIVVKSG